MESSFLPKMHVRNRMDYMCEITLVFSMQQLRWVVNIQRERDGVCGHNIQFGQLICWFNCMYIIIVGTSHIILSGTVNGSGSRSSKYYRFLIVGGFRIIILAWVNVWWGNEKFCFNCILVSLSRFVRFEGQLLHGFMLVFVDQSSLDAL
jgi:hypothetical protein